MSQRSHDRPKIPTSEEPKVEPEPEKVKKHSSLTSGSQKHALAASKPAQSRLRETRGLSTSTQSKKDKEFPLRAASVSGHWASQVLRDPKPSPQLSPAKVAKIKESLLSPIKNTPPREQSTKGADCNPLLKESKLTPVVVKKTSELKVPPNSPSKSTVSEADSFLSATDQGLEQVQTFKYPRGRNLPSCG